MRRLALLGLLLLSVFAAQTSVPKAYALQCVGPVCTQDSQCVPVCIQRGMTGGTCNLHFHCCGCLA